MNLYNIIYTGANQAYDAASQALTAVVAEKGKDVYKRQANKKASAEA